VASTRWGSSSAKPNAYESTDQWEGFLILAAVSAIALKVQDLEFCGADDFLIKVSNQLLLTVIAVGRQNPMMSPPQVLEHRELATARQKDRRERA
jgi:hypothetical protein